MGRKTKYQGGYCSRTVATWKRQYESSKTKQIKNVEVLMKWLSENVPKDDEITTIVHGDFR